MKSRVTTLLATMALVLMACSSGGATSPSAARAAPVATGEVIASANVELTVFGAASLKGVLDMAKAAYETATPGTTVAISTDSSSALEMQIEQGAPADLFL